MRGPGVWGGNSRAGEAVLRFSAAPKGPKQESPGGGNPACGVGPGDPIRMRIRPALKGRNKILDQDLFCPFKALLFSTPDPIPRAAPWAGMSLPLRGEIQEAQLQNFARGGKGLLPPCEGGRHCSLTTSLQRAQQKHASRNRPSSSVNTHFSSPQPRCQSYLLSTRGPRGRPAWCRRPRGP